MADISKIMLLNGQSYNLKDTQARQLIADLASQGITFVIAKDAGTTPVGVVWGNVTGTLQASVDNHGIYLVPAVVGNKTYYYEYVVINSGTSASPVYVWEKLGDTDISLEALGDLAYKDSVSATVNDYVTGATATFTSSALSSTGNYTPEGTVTAEFTGSAMTSTGTYVPAGTINKPAITVTPTSVTGGASKVKTAGSVSAGVLPSFNPGAFNAGSFSQGTDLFVAPTLTTSVSNETLVFNFNTGSFTQGNDSYVAPSKGADTFSAGKVTTVTLPTFDAVNIVSDVSAELATAPVFTGTSKAVSVSGTPVGDIVGTFSGTAKAVSVSGTPEGTISVTVTKGNKTIVGQ